MILADLWNIKIQGKLYWNFWGISIPHLLFFFIFLFYLLVDLFMFWALYLQGAYIEIRQDSLSSLGHDSLDFNQLQHLFQYSLDVDMHQLVDKSPERAAVTGRRKLPQLSSTKCLTMMILSLVVSLK